MAAARRLQARGPAIPAGIVATLAVCLAPLATWAYLGDLSARVFRDSLLFPLALTAIGFAVIACGICWQRHVQALRGWLPVP